MRIFKDKSYNWYLPIKYDNTIKELYEDKEKEKFRKTSAKEMFKRQNYDVLIDDERKIVYRLRKVRDQNHNYKALPKEIIFWKYEEIKSVDFIYGRLGSYLYLELLQAINKQVEELGWNER